MRIYNYLEAQQDLSAVLNTTLSQGVIVRKRNGQRFKIIPVKENMNQSPFDVSGINTDITTEKLVETLKQSRVRLE
ncbi:MAG: hypothetical protein LBR52_02830 [Prevotellaceae bacterium]|jgi:PAS domain-containing protein|nr:hypothetical protein [Prevotellaceae bacterium]